jgi:hypothetical protein
MRLIIFGKAKNRIIIKCFMEIIKERRLDIN